MGANRCALKISKRRNKANSIERDIVGLLRKGKGSLESARIKTEQLILENGMIEAFEWLQNSFDRITESCPMIASSKQCPKGLFEYVATLAYCWGRLDIREIETVIHQLDRKFPHRWKEENHILQRTPAKIIGALSALPPSRYLSAQKIQEIADRNNLSLSFTMDDLSVAHIRKEISVKLHCLSGREFEVQTSVDATLKEFKGEITALVQIPVDRIQLIYNTKLLPEAFPLGEVLPEGCTVLVMGESPELIEQAKEPRFKDNICCCECLKKVLVKHLECLSACTCGLFACLFIHSPSNDGPPKELTSV